MGLRHRQIPLMHAAAVGSIQVEKFFPLGRNLWLRPVFLHVGGDRLTKDMGRAVPSRMREELIYQRAYELAMSGFHINSITVVTALVQEGFPEAAELLNSDFARADLRDVCARHWRGVPPSVDDAAIVASPPSVDDSIPPPDQKASQ